MYKSRRNDVTKTAPHYSVREARVRRSLREKRGSKAKAKQEQTQRETSDAKFDADYATCSYLSGTFQVVGQKIPPELTEFTAFSLLSLYGVCSLLDSAILV